MDFKNRDRSGQTNPLDGMTCEMAQMIIQKKLANPAEEQEDLAKALFHVHFCLVCSQTVHLFSENEEM